MSAKQNSDWIAVDIRSRLQPVAESFAHVCTLIDSQGCLKQYSINMLAYTTVYNIATDQQYTSAVDEGTIYAGELLYNHFQELLCSYARRLTDESARVARDKTVRVRMWQRFKLAARWLSIAFRYLRSFFLSDSDSKRSGQYPSLEEVSRAIFFNCCLSKHVAEERASALAMVRDLRDGEAVPFEHLHGSVEMFEKMNISSQPTFFEDQFLQGAIQATRDHFDRWVSQTVATCHAAQFLNFCDEILRKEQDMFRRLFTSRSHQQRILEEVESALFDGSASRELILRAPSGLPGMLRERDMAAITALFRLMGERSRRVDVIAEVVRQQLIAEGTQQVAGHATQSEIDPFGAISLLFELHEAYSDMLLQAMQNNPIVARSIHDGIAKVIASGFLLRRGDGDGTGIISVAELLANFCDVCVRQQAHTKGIEATQRSIDRAISLLLLTQNRDLFLQRSRELLARRLLLSSAGEMEAAERLLVQQLKRSCGSQFTSSLEGMITDRTTSAELHVRYQCDVPGAFDCSFLTLRLGIWPFKPDVHLLRVPTVVQQRIAAFEKKYTGEFSRRVLKWMHSQSTAVVVGRFARGIRELSMTAHQAAVVMLLNDRAALTIAEAAAALDVPEEEVLRAVRGLARIKMIDLRDATFTVNDNFAPAQRKVQVPNAVAKVNVAAAVDLHHSVAEHRKPAVQASLVRVMKSRRRLSHNDLIGEVVRQLAHIFVPDPRLIKESIEYLIQRDMLQRDRDDASIYIYVA